MPDIQVPQPVLDLIRLREGRKNVSYADSLGKLTGGVGHLLSPSESHEYPEGTTIPNEAIEEWFTTDTTDAYIAALSQARQIGYDNPILTNALASVSFQLGAFWYKRLFGTWALLRQHDWAGAAQHEELSLWAKETPVRAKDFADALNSLVGPSTPADAIT